MPENGKTAQFQQKTQTVPSTHRAFWLSLSFWSVGTVCSTTLQSLTGLLPIFVYYYCRKFKTSLAAICWLLSVRNADGRGETEWRYSCEKSEKIGETPENQEFTPWVIPNVNKCCFQLL